MEKHKFASISLTVQDRAISSKFSTRRVSEQYTLGNFQKNFPLPIYGGHFEFSNFCQKWRNTNLLISLTMRDKVCGIHSDIYNNYNKILNDDTY